jgi:hypothetical protein
MLLACSLRVPSVFRRVCLLVGYALLLLSFFLPLARALSSGFTYAEPMLSLPPSLPPSLPLAALLMRYLCSPPLSIYLYLSSGFTYALLACCLRDAYVPQFAYW